MMSARDRAIRCAMAMIKWSHGQEAFERLLYRGDIVANAALRDVEAIEKEIVKDRDMVLGAQIVKKLRLEVA